MHCININILNEVLFNKIIRLRLKLNYYNHTIVSIFIILWT